MVASCGYRVYWVIFKDYLPVINKNQALCFYYVLVLRYGLLML